MPTDPADPGTPAGQPWAPPEAEVDDRAWSALPRWAVTGAAIALATAASLVPVPGLDAPNLLMAPRVVGGLHVCALLLAVRGAASVARGAGWGPTHDGAWFGLFAAATALWSWLAAVGLELADGTDGVRVVAPGLSFRALYTLSMLGGAAVSWTLARWVSRAGLGSGPLVLGVGWGVLTTLAAALALGTGDLVPSALVPGLSGLAVLATLAWRSPEWPWRPHPWLLVRSPLDAVLLPLVVGSVLLQLTGDTTFGVPAILTLAVAGVLISGSIRAPGATPRPLAAVLAGVVVAVVVGLAGLNAMLEAATSTTGPFAGDADLTLAIATPSPDPNDLASLRRRLLELRIDGTVTDRGDVVVLKLLAVDPGPALEAALLAPHRLTVHAVDESLTGVRQVDPSAELPPSAQPLTECVDLRAPCDPLVVGPVELDATAVADAEVIRSAGGGDAVVITLTDDGRERFARLSAELVGRRIALVVDGRTLSAPKILEPIPGGRMHLDMGGSADPQRDAAVLAAALRTPPLRGSWTVIHRDPTPR